MCVSLSLSPCGSQFLPFGELAAFVAQNREANTRATHLLRVCRNKRLCYCRASGKINSKKWLCERNSFDSFTCLRLLLHRSEQCHKLFYSLGTNHRIEFSTLISFLNATKCQRHFTSCLIWLLRCPKWITLRRVLACCFALSLSPLVFSTCRTNNNTDCDSDQDFARDEKNSARNSFASLCLCVVKLEPKRTHTPRVCRS